MLADVSLWCPRTFRAGMARSMPAVVSRATAFAPPLMSHTQLASRYHFWVAAVGRHVVGCGGFPSHHHRRTPGRPHLLSPHSRCYHQTTNRLSLLLSSRRVEQAALWDKRNLFVQNPPKHPPQKNISARLRHACLRHSHSGAGVGGRRWSRPPSRVQVRPRVSPRRRRSARRSQRSLGPRR